MIDVDLEAAEDLTPALTWPGRIVRILRRDTPLALLDLAIVFCAYLTVLVLGLNGKVTSEQWSHFRLFMPVVATFHLMANYVFGLYGQMWRYASVQEARRVVLAGMSGSGLVMGIALLVGHGSHILPWRVLLGGGVGSLIGFGALRFQSRLFAFRRYSGIPDRKRVLLVGAGDAAAMVLTDIARNPSIGLAPVAIVDDDPRKRGLSLRGVRIVGGRAAIPQIVSRLHVDQVLVAIPSATSDLIREVAELCEEANVTLRVLPSVREIVGNRVTARDVRDLRIEDLLGREQVPMDQVVVASMLQGRRVLITGAGGSIGSEIARQVHAFGPASLVILDHDETHLHDLLTDLEGEVPVEQALVDIRDQDRLLGVFMRYRPEVVFHAAAHKHVPVLETHPSEALFTNVLGTANVADAAVATEVGRFVLISTDKAVNPLSVMGCSKWFAEQIVRSLQGRGNAQFCAVRFGNVLGSRGSVIPTFLRQIARGGPVTVTDPSMTRYFMSVHEAVQLVLQAAALSEGGEVFTLDMGQPVNIMDLARKLIRLAGRVPGTDIAIEVVGTRPGEKLAEEIVNPDEEAVNCAHQGISASRPAIPDRGALRQGIRELETLAARGDGEALARRMRELTCPSVVRLPEEAAV